MLSRKYKLSRVSFPLRTDARSSWVGGVLRVQAYKGSNQAVMPRFAVIVPKRLSDSAVMRHAFKRQVMSIIEQRLTHFRQLPYQKYVITPGKHIRMITREHICADVEDFLAQPQAGRRP